CFIVTLVLYRSLHCFTAACAVSSRPPAQRLNDVSCQSLKHGNRAAPLLNDFPILGRTAGRWGNDNYYNSGMNTSPSPLHADEPESMHPQTTTSTDAASPHGHIRSFVHRRGHITARQ